MNTSHHLKNIKAKREIKFKTINYLHIGKSTDEKIDRKERKGYSTHVLGIGISTNNVQSKELSAILTYTCH
jgi:hypothetical protein